MSVRRISMRVFVDWSVPVLALVCLTVPFWITDLDIRASTPFYMPGVGWVHGSGQPWVLLKHYGVIPAWVVAVSSLIVLLTSPWMARFRRYRRATAFLVLAMSLGPGLLVNVVFKDQWGRPRPRDIYAFDGDRAYVAPWIKSAPENGNSFASGHASTGFYLLVPYFLVRRRSKMWAAFFVVLGLGYGSLMGLARMIQGAHFLSDVLWALGFVYLVALGLFYALRLERRETSGRGGIERLPTVSDVEG